MIHTVKGFSVVDETEVDIFLEFPCFLYDPASVGNLISDSSSFSKPSLDIWKFLVHIMLKSSMQDFMHDLTSMGWLPWWFSGKEFACNAGDVGSIPGSGWSPGESLRTASIATIKVTMTSMKNYWSSCQIFPVCHVLFWNSCSHAEEWTEMIKTQVLPSSCWEPMREKIPWAQIKLISSVDGGLWRHGTELHLGHCLLLPMDLTWTGIYTIKSTGSQVFQPRLELPLLALLGPHVGNYSSWDFLSLHNHVASERTWKPSLKNSFFKMVEWKDVCSSSPGRTPKLQLAAEQPSTGECCIPPKKKKKIPHVQGQRRCPNK